MQDNDFRALTNIIDRKISTGVWGEKEIKEYNDQIARLSGLTLDQDHVWTMAWITSTRCCRRVQDLANRYLSPPASALKQKIGAASSQEATGGQGFAPEKDQLSRDLEGLSRLDGVRRETLDNYTQIFEQNVRNETLSGRKNLISS